MAHNQQVWCWWFRSLNVTVNVGSGRRYRRSLSSSPVGRGWRIRLSANSKDFIYKDGKMRALKAIPACNLKTWPPYWKHDNE